MASLDRFIEWFHSGYDEDFEKVLKVFKRTRNFLKLVASRKMQDKIDIGYIPNREFKNDPELFNYLGENGFLENVSYTNIDEEQKNYYLLWLIEKDQTEGLKFICDNILSDVEIRSDGYWLKLAGREELAEFFRSYSREISPEDIAKQVFSEEGLDYGRFWDTSDDVYVDVIETLDGANTEILKKYIIRHIGNQDLNIENYSADFFHELMKSQGREDFFQITDNDVKSLIDDSEAMNELLDGDLSELKGELDSIHSNAYNAAYESKVYDLVMGGLGEYFSSRINEVEKQIGEKTRYIPYIKIRSFYNNVMTFLNEYKGYTDTLEYYGSYTEMMKQLFNDGTYEPIDFRIPEYADWSLIDKYINEFFPDYI